MRRAEVILGVLGVDDMGTHRSVIAKFLEFFRQQNVYCPKVLTR